MGLISWLCVLLLIFAIACGAILLLTVAFNPTISEDLSNIFSSILYSEEIPQHIVIRLVCSFCLLVACIILIVVFRKDRKIFEASMANFLSKIWVEIKILLIPASFFLVYLIDIFWVLTLFLVIFIVYVLCLDIGYNKTFFRHNIVHSILKAVNPPDAKTPYEKRARKRLTSTVAVISGILVLTAILLSTTIYIRENYFLDTFSEGINSLIFVSIIVFSIVGIIGTVLWYSVALKKDLHDLSSIMMQIEKMYGGHLNAINHIPPTSNFYDCAMQLNMIRTGIEKAVDEGIKADRTKVELITNVSHDIKTPLTSIITYVELLKKESALPDHVMDYVTTISKKADRLSNIVQDVFEVSKAATGNISLNMDNLDMSKLLQQTMAEMDETIQNSGLTWRVDIPDTPVMIHADGQKLYRVFQNLIRNSAQYSLEGSRAYVALKVENNKAEVSIRNISKNELDSSAAEYLTGRFVRGDQNRTTEGSGLGLSIAKTFTEACGGSFSIKIDGDIFLTTVQFPIVGTPVLNRGPVPELTMEPIGYVSGSDDEVTENTDAAHNDVSVPVSEK